MAAHRRVVICRVLSARAHSLIGSIACSRPKEAYSRPVFEPTAKRTMQNEIRSPLEARDALYYPYVHFRDEDWLKKTLLVFPRIFRIAGSGFSLHDSEFVYQLRKQAPNGKGLLEELDFRTLDAFDALAKVREKISEDAKRDQTGFILKYGFDSGGSLYDRQQRPFRMAPDGSSYNTMEQLKHLKLASGGSSSYDLHPKIGQVIMSTFAFACAEHNGLHLVTDGKDFDCHWLNSCIGTRGIDQIYDTLLHPESDQPLLRADHTALFEIIVYHHCDPNSLTLERLAKFSEERGPYERLKSELQKLALSIPAMKNQERLHEKLEDVANDALKRWRSDQFQMGSIAREIFADGGGNEPRKIVEGLIEKARHPEVWSGFTAGLLGQHTMSSLMGTAGQILAVVGGTAIGVIFNGFTQAYLKSKSSPFRYLTDLEKAGVTFTIGA